MSHLAPLWQSEFLFVLPEDECCWVLSKGIPGVVMYLALRIQTLQDKIGRNGAIWEYFFNLFSNHLKQIHYILHGIFTSIWFNLN